MRNSMTLQEFGTQKRAYLKFMIENELHEENRCDLWQQRIQESDQDLLASEGNLKFTEQRNRFAQLLDIKLPFLFGRKRYRVIKNHPNTMTLAEKCLLAAYLEKLNNFHIAVRKEKSEEDTCYWGIYNKIKLLLNTNQENNLDNQKKDKIKFHENKQPPQSSSLLDDDPYYGYGNGNSNLIVFDENHRQGNGHRRHPSPLIQHKKNNIIPLDKKLNKNIITFDQALNKDVTHGLSNVVSTTDRISHIVASDAINTINEVGSCCSGDCDCGDGCGECCCGCCSLSGLGGGFIGAIAAIGSSSGSNKKSSNSNNNNNNKANHHNSHSHHNSLTNQNGSGHGGHSGHHGFFGNVRNNAQMLKHGHPFHGWHHAMWHMTWATPFVMIYAAYTFLIVGQNFFLDVAKLVKCRSSSRDRKAAAQDLGFTLLFGAVGFALGMFFGPHTAMMFALMGARFGRFLSKKWRKHSEKKHNDGISNPEKYVPTAEKLTELTNLMPQANPLLTTLETIESNNTTEDYKQRILLADQLNAAHRAVKAEKQEVINRSTFRKGDNGVFSTIGHKMQNSFRGYHKRQATDSRRDGLSCFGLFSDSEKKQTQEDVNGLKTFVEDYYAPYDETLSNIKDPIDKNTNTTNIEENDNDTPQSIYH